MILVILPFFLYLDRLVHRDYYAFFLGPRTGWHSLDIPGVIIYICVLQFVKLRNQCCPHAFIRKRES